MATTPRNIILVGFMASGKTSVGRALAQRTGWTLVDADDVIVARAGKPIHRIFSEDGEPAFRELERQVIADLCAGERQVIASGGGAFVDPQNRHTMLSGGQVFYLSASPAEILRRVREEDAGGPIRPLLAVEDPEARIAELLAQRTPAYAQAHHTVETDELTAEGVAAEVMGGWFRWKSSIRTNRQEPEMVAHKWEPLTGLDSRSANVDFQEIDSLHQQWANFREQREASNPDAYKAFLERLERRWAIETGIIEGIYDIDRGVTRSLVENGLNIDYIERGSTNRNPQELIKVLEDHQETAKFVTEHIRRQRPLSRLYIQELHEILTRNQPTFPAVNPNSGRTFHATLYHGEFKKWPNNPTRRRDGQVHEYCPPVQVDSELDGLIQWYNEFQSDKGDFHPLLVAAWLHHRFTQIHPFPDGNGRVARALLIWHLVKENYLPVVISRDERVAYIDSLEAADIGDLSQFVLLLVQLKRRTILEALGEPEPVEALGLVDQVVGHIVEQIKRQNQDRQTQMRSVSEVAHALRNNAISNLVSRADQICQPLNEAGLSIARVVDRGGPGDREHWYQTGVIQTAQEAQHWVNLNESRYFIKLSLNPEDQSRAPRLVFVISLHHVGQQLTGIMAATAFAEIRDSREPDSEESQESPGLYFRNCTVDPFTFTWQDDADAIAQRFGDWVEERLSIALRYWSEFIS